MLAYKLYEAIIFENMSIELKIKEISQKSAVLISNFLPIYNPTHLIIRDILYYLQKIVKIISVK